MAVNRCSMCGTNWPHHKSFNRCPVCLEKTDTVVRGKPITFTEAKKLANEAEFERYYAEHDRRRKGPSPEEIGAEEARSIYELDQAFNERETTVAELNDAEPSSS